MKATDFVLMFERDWLPKYPDLRFFTASSVTTDILYWAKEITATLEERDSLSSFLVKYLKENPGRFQFTGMNGFRVLDKKV